MRTIEECEKILKECGFDLKESYGSKYCAGILCLAIWQEAHRFESVFSVVLFHSQHRLGAYNAAADFCERLREG